MTQPSQQPIESVLMQQAYEQLQEGSVEEAIETFSAALVVGSQQAQILRGRGLAYAQLRRWSLAAADFSSAKDLAPEDPDNWVDLGISLAMDHRVYPAIEVFEALLAKYPHCVRGHLELGRLHVQLGAIPKARQHLQQALRHRPTLEQRRLIESILHEQDLLDRKRFYRPDFEALRKERARTTSTSWITSLTRWWGRLWRKSGA